MKRAASIFATTLISCSLVGALAYAATVRPSDAIEADRAAAQADVADLERRMRSLDEQMTTRRTALKRRVAALYKMSRGGYLRLLFDRDRSPALLRRQAVVRRVLARDLDELGTLAAEAKQLTDERSARAAQIAHALDLEHQYSRREDGEHAAFSQKRGHLERPVPGAIMGAFGAHRDSELKIELLRRGVELGARAGQTVRTVAAGRVSWIGEVRGLGRAVAIDHGDGFVSLTARLSNVAVELGQGLAAQMPIGEADGRRVYFEIAEGRTPLDPAVWLAPRH